MDGDYSEAVLNSASGQVVSVIQPCFQKNTRIHVDLSSGGSCVRDNVREFVLFIVKGSEIFIIRENICID